MYSTADDVLLLIMMFLTARQCNAIMKTCKRLNKLKNNPFVWNNKDVALYNAEALPQLSQYNIKTLRLYIMTGLEPWHLNTISYMPSLTMLDISNNTGLDNGTLENLVNSTILHLNISSCPHITDFDITHLCTLAKLCSLNISNCAHLTLNRHSSIADMHNLTTLIMTHNAIDDGMMQCLITLDTLTHLDISDCKGLSRNGYMHISHIVSIRTLIMARCELGNGDLQSISNLPKLEHLDITNCEHLTKFASISNIQTLTFLNMSVCMIEDMDMCWICDLPSLKTLNIFSCPLLTSEVYDYIAVAADSIMTLKVSGDVINDKNLHKLSSIHTLTDLDLSYCGGITDNALQVITERQTLKRLRLWYCKAITPDCVRRLSAELPSLVLTHVHM
jgi:hypothetical protein